MLVSVSSNSRRREGDAKTHGAALSPEAGFERSLLRPVSIETLDALLASLGDGVETPPTTTPRADQSDVGS